MRSSGESLTLRDPDVCWRWRALPQTVDSVQEVNTVTHRQRNPVSVRVPPLDIHRATDRLPTFELLPPVANKLGPSARTSGSLPVEIYAAQFWQSSSATFWLVGYKLAHFNLENGGSLSSKHRHRLHFPDTKCCVTDGHKFIVVISVIRPAPFYISTYQMYQSLRCFVYVHGWYNSTTNIQFPSKYRKIAIK